MIIGVAEARREVAASGVLRVEAFAAFDHRLREAAARDGFVLVPPTG